MSVHASLESALLAPRTPFVGRTSDVLAITRWLDEGERLVTITGPAGMGKTRVALEVARTADVTTTVAWVSLDNAHDDAGLCDAISAALHIADEDGAGDPVAQVGRALRSRGDLLLCLDALDGLSSRTSDTLGVWLRMAPELLLLVASRERTRLPGEVVHELLPLPEAYELFVTCAARIRAGFSPAGADKEIVQELTQELEGVPLAIELCAARLSIMAPRALLYRIRTSGSPGEPALERAMVGTWTSLSADEQRVVASVTVFRGGFTVISAEAVLDPALPTLDALMSLRDRSLLLSHTDENGDVRLDLYRAFRAFASRKLEENKGERARLEARHATYYASVATMARGQQNASGRAQLLVERDNLLSIIHRVTTSGTVSAQVAEPALRALLGLWPVLLAHGALRTYEVLVDPAIASTRGSGADPALVAEVLLVRGALHRHRGAASKGARDLVQALGIARTIGNERLEAQATFELAHALNESGDLPAAEEHLRRAATLFSACKSAHDEGRAHASLAALVARTGRGELARHLLLQALSAHTDDPEARAEDLRAMGALELQEGRLAAARAATEESLALVARTDGRSAALARMQLGLVAQRAGDRPLARANLERASGSFAALGFSTLAAIAEGHLGVIAHEENKLAEAKTRLGSAVESLAEVARGPEASLFAERLRALSHPEVGPAPAPDDALLVGAEGAWFRPPNGARVGLERRRPLAAIAERLTAERIERPDSPLGTRALQDVAWPGEKLAAAAGAHRVRVAISTLRKLGFPIVTGDDGYVLAPTTLVVRA